MGDKNKDGNSTVLHGKYELGRLLGHGTFAKVYHAKNFQTGKSVAMKVVGKEKVIKVGMMEQVKREISVMKMVKHPNIVELHEVMASKSKIYFAMELVRGGELFSKISKGRLKEDLARVYFQQLISAIDFCHSRGVYHRDLKPENLLLDEDGSLKVTDFGLSAFSEHLKQDGLLHTTCGTPAYVAPEVIGKKGYDGSKADIWSCGVILYVLLAGFLPFQDDNIVAMYRHMHKCSKITWTAETQAFGHAGIKQQENTCSRGKTHGQQKKIIRTMQEHSHMCSRNITCRNSLGSYTPAHMQAAHTKHSTQTTCSSHKLRIAHIQLHTTEAIITQLIRITPSCRKHSDSNHAWDPNKHIIATQPLTRKGY